MNGVILVVTFATTRKSAADFLVTLLTIADLLLTRDFINITLSKKSIVHVEISTKVAHTLCLYPPWRRVQKEIYFDSNGLLAKAWCKFKTTGREFFLTVSILVITAVAFDRYHILHRVSLSQSRPAARIALLSIVILGWSLLCSAPLMYFSSLTEVANLGANTTYSCIKTWTMHSIEDCNFFSTYLAEDANSTKTYLDSQVS